MPEYGILAHRRVIKFLQSLRDEKPKNSFKEIFRELQSYPLALRRLDVEKLEGMKRAYRIHIEEIKVPLFLGNNSEGSTRVNSPSVTYPLAS